jgi:branched-chain amino acid aminotransferase
MWRHEVFFVVREEVVTPSLTGTILPGITRDSVITLLRDMGFSVKEDRVSMDELLRSYERGELQECFGTGTAATVSHVRRIRYGVELSSCRQSNSGKQGLQCERNCSE